MFILDIHRVWIKFIEKLVKKNFLESISDYFFAFGDFFFSSASRRFEREMFSSRAF